MRAPPSLLCNIFLLLCSIGRADGKYRADAERLIERLKNPVK